MEDTDIERTTSILHDALSHVYCDTCGGETDTDCDDCNRKAMGWYPSDGFINGLAKLIHTEASK